MKLSSTIVLLCMLLSSTVEGTVSKPRYTLRRKTSSEQSKAAKTKTTTRQLSTDETMRSTTYEHCGKSGKDGGKDGGKGNSRRLNGCSCSKGDTSCYEYDADPLDDPLLISSPDDGPTPAPNVPPPTPAPVITTLAPVITLAPATLAPETLAPETLAPETLAPETLAPATRAPISVGAQRDESGSNQSLDVDAEYDPYVPSNDFSDRTGDTGGNGESSPIIVIGGGQEPDDDEDDDVPSNDDESNDRA